MLKRKTTLREFDKRSAEILARMRSEATPFADDSPEAKRKRRERGLVDRMWFYKAYLPHYFSEEWDDFHYELAQYLDITDDPVFLAAPPETGKTSIIEVGELVRWGCLKLKKFIIHASATEDLSTDKLRFVKMEFEENERIKQDFGEMRGRDWEDGDFTLRSGSRYKSRGRGQAILGLTWRQHRPDAFVAADVETEKSVRNQKITTAVKDWFLETVLPRLTSGYTFIYAGNLLSATSALAQLIGETDEHGRKQFPGEIYRMEPEPGTSLCPNLWPVDRIESTRAKIGPIRFNRVYNFVFTDASPFAGHIYWEPLGAVADKSLRYFGAIDPSAKADERSDYKAIVVIGVEDGKIVHVVDSWIRHATVDQMIEKFYDLHLTYLPHWVMRGTAMEFEYLKSDFERVGLARSGLVIIPKHITESQNKMDRIYGMENRFVNGLVRLVKGMGDNARLAQQLVIIHEASEIDDGPDALQAAMAEAQGNTGDVLTVLGQVQESMEEWRARKEREFMMAEDLD